MILYINWEGVHQLGGCINLQYANDIALLASTEEELQELVSNPLNVAGSEFGLMIIVDKTKVMGSDEISCTITIYGVVLEQVNSFTYLGAAIT